MVAAIGIDAGEKDKLHPANHATDIVGGEALPAIAQPGASGVRLEQVGGEIDEGIGRDPFPGMQSTRDDDGIQAGRIRRADAQRVRMPTLRSCVGELNQFGDVWMGPRECLNRDLDLVDVQVGHGFIP